MKYAQQMLGSQQKTHVQSNRPFAGPNGAIPQS
jgi:hypothetical protein